MTMKGWQASTGSGTEKGLLVRLSEQWEANGTGHSSRHNHQRRSRAGADEFVFHQPPCWMHLIFIPTETHNKKKNKPSSLL